MPSKLRCSMVFLRFFDYVEDDAEELAELALCCWLFPPENGRNGGRPKLFCWLVEDDCDSENDDDCEWDPPWCGGPGGPGNGNSGGGCGWGKGNSGGNGGDLPFPG